MKNKKSNLYFEHLNLNKSDYILSSGIKIYYQIFGHGVPIIMLHGNSQNSSFFKKQLVFLQDFFQVILVDSRGHGKSEFGNKKLSLDILSNDIVNLITSLNIEHSIILGFSDGGNIAIKLAEKIPEKLIAVISVSPNLTPDALRKWFRIVSEITYYICSKLSHVEWFEKKSQLLYLIIKESTISKDNLSLIKIPMLLICGEYDIIHRKHIKMISKLLLNSKYLIVKRSGHNLLKTHSNYINLEIYSFIKTLKS